MPRATKNADPFMDQPDGDRELNTRALRSRKIDLQNKPGPAKGVSPSKSRVGDLHLAVFSH